MNHYEEIEKTIFEDQTVDYSDKLDLWLDLRQEYNNSCFKPTSRFEKGTPTELPFYFLPVKREPICICGHSKWIHRKEGPITKENCKTGTWYCFCDSYKLSNFNYYWDRGPVLKALKIIGAIISIILMIFLTLLSLTTVVWLGGLLVVIVPTLISSWIGKR